MSVHTVVSEVQRDTLDTHTMVSDIHRNMLKVQEEADHQHRSVSGTEVYLQSNICLLVTQTQTG